ncbi:hypothetical protein OSB04_032233 [Centaurea solstitialis]|uniref:Uncharacterized protein n=1 Tax=Centaurea solstitialis TaxID=347529 RepID=A0AA38SNP3_9ASTR|nr:hypothetical protein OSB04_032233 [Centaurea solstitialis]
MAYSTMSVSSQPTTPKAESPRMGNPRPNILNRSISGQNLRQHARIQRAYSDNNLCYSANRVRASMSQPKLKNGIFDFSLSGGSSIIPNSLKTLLFETDDESSSTDGSDVEMEKREKKRANWIERLMEIRGRWVQKQDDNEVIDGEKGEEEEESCDGDGDGCEVDYSDDEGSDGINQETFSKLLKHVSWSDTKNFSQLAFLCNMAYVIPEIEEDDLRRYYDLTFVTSSLEKKALAERIAQDSIRLPSITNQTPENHGEIKQQRINRTSAYEIAASAATYVQSHAEGLVSLKSEPQPQEDDGVLLSQKDKTNSSSPRVYNSEMAAYMAASTMTAVVAAPEKEKQEAAKDLQSLHSSPCEWFICDDSSIYTRCFVIQGSDSVASWQANLFFEPTKFEVVKPSALRPVVTFGSPFVFCNGQKILDQLGLDENHVHCVMMHRDIVPRAFSCNYPNHVAQLLKRLCGTFRSHPCLNRNVSMLSVSLVSLSDTGQNNIVELSVKPIYLQYSQSLLYTPLGKMFILQPDEKSSPHHPLLPRGSALYAMENTQCGSTKNALRSFLNSPHPIETLQHPTPTGPMAPSLGTTTRATTSRP